MKPHEPANVTLTIDGRTATAPFGATILEAARAAGVKIPHLCQHEWIHRLASCRLCLVKVEGVAGVVASCATPAMDGMVVTTNDEEIHRLRQQQMQFILLNHPLDCPVCDKAGECKLQDLTYQLGVSDVPFVARMEEQRIDRLSPLIERNDARCIRCGRCVAVCEEVQAVGAYQFDGRGYRAKINTKTGGPLDCEFCGQCLAVCPVGALLSKQFKHKARVWDLQRVQTVCGYCGAGCQLELQTRRGRIHRATSDRRTSNNDGKLCIRGRFGWDVARDERRQTRPLIRRDGELVETTWDEALDAVAEGLRHASSSAGPESIAALAGGRLPVEDAYALAWLCGALLGSRRVAVAGQDAFGVALTAIHDRLGGHGSTASFADLRAADVIMLLGSDLAAEMPVPHLAAIAAVREGDARLIHAGPLPTKLEAFAAVRLRHRPGAQTALLLALLRELIDQKRQNLEFLMKRTDDFAAFKAALDRLDPAALSAAAGVPAEAVKQAAAVLGAAAHPVIVLGPLALAGAGARAVADLTIDLLLTLGKIERSLLLSADRCDLVGVMLAGLAPGRLPGLATYEALPNGWPKLPQQPGLGEAGVIEAGATGRLNALLVWGVDPLVHGTNAEALRKAMEVTGFVVVCDSFLTETAKKAHVFLPAAAFAERAGTYVSAEGRVLRLNPATPPRDEAWPEWKIVNELAKRLGQTPPFGSLADIRAAAAAAAPILAELGKDGLPAKGALLPRTLPGENVKLPFSQPPTPPTGPEGDLVLVAGAVFQHNGSLSSWSAAIAEVSAGPWVELHPSDAARRGLRAGDRVRLTARGVELQAPVRLNDQLTPGVVFAPRHFAAFPVGRLLGDEPYVAVTAAKQN